VANGTVEMIQAPGYYYVGKDPALCIMADIPFGMNARQKNAWMYHGGGNELINEYVARFNVHCIAGGNTGTQMGGWFRKEVKTVADLQGLKFRIAGIAGQVLAKLGAVPQQIAGGEIYPALERGTIDAAEWVGPYDDEKLGFQKVAPFYYYPGFWEGGPTVHLWFAKEKWEGLPKHYKAVCEAAAGLANLDMTMKYDAKNPAALRRLVAAGAQLRPFSQEIMEAGFKASNEIYDDLSAKNADWKKLYESLRAFRNEEYLWWQVAEYTFDNFMIRARARG
jgi:TRAP-type mannitol/chloroaromatic compound transport system substrate-binding protein